jgi:hypothetical protein
MLTQGAASAKFARNERRRRGAERRPGDASSERSKTMRIRFNDLAGWPYDVWRGEPGDLATRGRGGAARSTLDDPLAITVLILEQEP